MDKGGMGVMHVHSVSSAPGIAYLADIDLGLSGCFHEGARGGTSRRKTHTHMHKQTQFHARRY